MNIRPTSFLFESKKIGGFLYVPEGKGKFPAVVFVHGFSGGTHEVKNKFMCEQLALSGMVAFMFDFYDKPNGLSDLSIEDMSVSLQLRVVRAVIDYVCGLSFVDVNLIGLTGHSLGGMTVLLYTPTDVRVKVLVVQSAVSDFAALSRHWGEIEDWKRKGVKHFSRSWGDMDVKYALVEDGLKYDVYKIACQIKCPVLVFHGDLDESVLVAESEKLMHSLKRTDEFVVLHGSGHTYKEVGMKEKATSLLIEFMKKNLLS